MATVLPKSLVPSPLWANGPTPGQIYNFPGATKVPDSFGTQRTMNPSVTSTSVLGLKFKGGVMIAGDLLGSYGSLARYRNCPRLMKVNDQTVLGASGDYADYQFLTSIIQQRVIEEDCLDDGFSSNAPGLHSWLTRVLYNRRNQFNPLWNTYLVGGMFEDEPFLGYVDKIGVAYEADTIATGFGAYLALPILRDGVEKNKKLDEKQALSLIDRCMRLLYCRDARSINKYQVAVVTSEGAEVQGPIDIKANWEIAHMVKGYE